MKWLTRLLRSHEIGEAVALARHYNRLGVACARKSIEQGSDWQIAARKHHSRAKAIMWQVRQLVG